MTLAALRLGRRLPLVLQTEAAECGLACLAMIASYHGAHVDLATLRRRYPASLKGVTLAGLMDLAQRLDLATRAVRLELHDLHRLRLPCILHWSFNHFVVLERVGRRAVVIHDPARGERKLAHAEVSAAFTGVALELWPDAGFTPREERRRVRLRTLVGRVTGLYRSAAHVLLLGAALEVFAALSPLFLQWVIDHALLTASRDLLTTLAVGFGLLVVTQHLVAALRAWVIACIGATWSVQWQSKLFAHLLELPLGYFERRHLGDIVSRFRSIDAIQRTLTTSVIETLLDGAMTVVILALVLLYSPALTAVCLAAIALYAAGRWLSYGALRRATEEQIVHAAAQDSHFIETVRGVRAIKLFGRQIERRTAWQALLVEQVGAGVRTQRLQILVRLLNGLAFGLENVLVVWLGARLALDGALTVGMLMAFLSYKGQLAARVAALVDKLVEIRMLRLQGERLADIALAETEPRHPAGRLALEADGALEPTVALRGVRFRYGEHEPWVLDGVDLEVAAGECVAIVGPSGCGKSTLLHLILGILSPDEGDVLIGGKSAALLGAETVRAMIGAVLQNDTLYAGSVADNISFFDGRADQSRVEASARLASIHDEIAAMPMGYNTLVGHMGAALSGGQQQRILLARALYKRPAILVLDEATSHLDVPRETRVNAAIRHLDVTRIVVAHRPQTAAAADRIVTLERGRIVNESRPARAAPARQRSGAFPA